MWYAYVMCVWCVFVCCVCVVCIFVGDVCVCVGGMWCVAPIKSTQYEETF